jgi:hypothetical protein
VCYHRGDNCRRQKSSTFDRTKYCLPDSAPASTPASPATMSTSATATPTAAAPITPATPVVAGGLLARIEAGEVVPGLEDADVTPSAFAWSAVSTDVESLVRTPITDPNHGYKIRTGLRTRSH